MSDSTKVVDMCCAEKPAAKPKLRAVKARGTAASAKSAHPDHAMQVKKLNRVIGQLQGVQRMIDERRYCPDILIQTRAAASALRAIEMAILEKHLKNCVTSALSSQNPAKANAKIDELLDLFSRL